MWKRKKINLNENNNDLIVQCVDWNTENITVNKNEPSSEEEETIDNENGSSIEYNIKLFGITQDNKSICVSIEEFTPYFYLEVPLSWTKRNTSSLKNYIVNQFEINSPKFKNDMLTIGIVTRKKMYNFTNFTKFKFIRVVFRNTIAMKICEKMFYKTIKLPGFNRKIKLIHFETNIDPLLRFFHIREINPE